MATVKVRDRGMQIGVFEMPNIDSYSDIRLAQKALGMNKEEFLFAVHRGLQIHLMNVIRAKWYHAGKPKGVDLFTL